MKFLLLLGVLSTIAVAQSLDLPPRPVNALSGTQVVEKIRALSREAREDTLFAEIMRGNIPEFMRSLVKIQTAATIHGSLYTLQYFVTPDYMSVGSDEDYFLAPMTPLLAQKLANALSCTLPTWKMVNHIYTAASVKLPPQPIPPDANMITVPRFKQHNDSVWSLRAPLLQQYPLGSLVGGTKKDVIIDKKVYSWIKGTVPKPVVIYGWHQLNGVPIQPTYNGHGETYADYSHGIRLVLRTGKMNGAEINLLDLMKDADFYSMLADTILIKPYYHSLTDVNDETYFQIPLEFQLHQNFPNPFNPETTIAYDLNSGAHIRMRLFDTLGREVASLIDTYQSAGSHTYHLRVPDHHLSSGVYFLSFNANGIVHNQKIMVLQ